MKNSQLAHREDEIAMKNAINNVTKNGLAIRLAAMKFAVTKSALYPKVLKYRTFSWEPRTLISYGNSVLNLYLQYRTKIF